MKSIKTLVRVSFVFSLLIVCAEISNAQAIEVVRLKNGFEAKGTITSRTESSIVLQTENGKTLTISNDDIESIGQENMTFDPKILVGQWYCYDDVSESLDNGCGTVFADGPGGKWNVYFVKQ